MRYRSRQEMLRTRWDREWLCKMAAAQQIAGEEEDYDYENSYRFDSEDRELSSEEVLRELFEESR